MTTFDILVVGGGINGCGIARDAVGRGFKVLLAEKSDLASGTSSWSTKLIHGGLRYLEHREFRLVRESLEEREVLLRMAPHIIWPLRFVLPHHRGLRPAWLLRLGLFLYDHLGGRKLLPATRTLDLRSDEAGKPLKAGFSKAFEYSDCWVMDSRLVALNARDAADRGAEIRTRTVVTSLRRDGEIWVATMKGEAGTEEMCARMVVNAAGPWVDEVIRGPLDRNDARNVRLVQGSHIVVRKLFDHDRCYIFQNADGRIIFAIPYEGDFTLVGTTDRDYKGDPGSVRITDAEIDYLLSAADEYFERPIRRDDVVWTYSGVRPLFDDGASSAQEATRDYVLKVDGGASEPKVLNIFGGKITTYRRLAESVMEKVEAALGARGPRWTATASLPGGDFAPDGFGDVVRAVLSEYPFLADPAARRLVRLYGTRARAILGTASSDQDLGRDFGNGLTEAEVRYLADQEWARSADDVLWRRTKMGLKLPASAVAAVDDFITAHLGAVPAPSRS
ncbi:MULTISPECIES: glycerol-3-phosphate dehydrogenase [unclassified Aureimonas]|uniref:glycerol-3-phosphate dehydrogenase n=1 Tax=unclassified Aureimonas TaxID=2615206 RepID=UPI0006FFCFE6|nr:MULTISPECIES: glycerol-3-phosphate dehydrogenase [unclassified Aureimonas]KQT52304.1 glycerol-3-phosphate dehydrogenase [Aureimonas sp. Leaf427]KQT61810.1 glycerol-3-phosphate dehydrogenase [Aureimonas sp. Leaf460]